MTNYDEIIDEKRQYDIDRKWKNISILIHKYDTWTSNQTEIIE